MSRVASSLLLPRREILRAGLIAAPALILAREANAFWQSRDSNYNKSTGSFAIFNSARKGADIVLSGGSLVATQSNVGAFESALGTKGATTGKYYCELTISALGAVSNGVGIGNASASMATFLGADLNGVSMFGNGQTFINGANVGACAIFSAAPANISLAVDLTNGFSWSRNNNGAGASGLWNDNAGADPASNTIGAISLATLNAGPYFPGVVEFTLNDAWTANFGASAYLFGVPTNFGNW